MVQCACNVCFDSTLKFVHTVSQGVCCVLHCIFSFLFFKFYFLLHRVFDVVHRLSSCGTWA